MDWSGMFRTLRRPSKAWVDLTPLEQRIARIDAIERKELDEAWRQLKIGILAMLRLYQEQTQTARHAAALARSYEKKEEASE